MDNECFAISRIESAGEKRIYLKFSHDENTRNLVCLLYGMWINRGFYCSSSLDFNITILI
jgi:hypothetical protein